MGEPRGEGSLRTENLTKRFGALAALDSVTLSIAPGARHAIIGPNGAGKTTLINLLCGAMPPTAGDIFIGDEPITALAQHQRAKRGLTRTHQVTSLFPGLTVLESVHLAVLERKGQAARFTRVAEAFREEADEAQAILASLGLEGEAPRRTAELPYGRQRLLEIALGLATRPSILLLDEPAAGIPAAQSIEVFGVIARLPADVTVIFIEHDMGLVFRFAQRITVLVAGRVLMEGTPGEVAGDARVRAVYLGEEVHG